LRDKSLMPSTVTPFTDEQTRLLVNLEQQYEVWIEAERLLAALPYGMRWKTSAGREYLYEIRDRAGNGRSIGPRSPETEAVLADYRQHREQAADRRDGSAGRLAESGRLYRALRLPMIPSQAAAILREADRRSLLGSHLLVVGTNAMAAYAIEAAGRFDAPDETEDFDMSWIAPLAGSGEADANSAPIWDMLHAVDTTYTVNSERPFQARNAKAYEVEILTAPSRIGGPGRRDRPRPHSLPEQEWLLNGTMVSQTVVARDGSPARLVVPDPRWFALQKLWMSAQDKRNPLKRPKDARQGNVLLDVVADAMPRFPLDADFEACLPPELEPHYSAWKETRAGKPRASRSW
jgi:hypothetical protein